MVLSRVERVIFGRAAAERWRFSAKCSGYRSPPRAARQRGAEAEAVREVIVLTINGIAAGLCNTG
jgi:phosphoenolpyruvate carboxylase